MYISALLSLENFFSFLGLRVKDISGIRQTWKLTINPLENSSSEKKQGFKNWKVLFPWCLIFTSRFLLSNVALVVSNFLAGRSPDTGNVWLTTTLQLSSARFADSLNVFLNNPQVIWGSLGTFHDIVWYHENLSEDNWFQEIPELTSPWA